MVEFDGFCIVWFDVVVLVGLGVLVDGDIVIGIDVIDLVFV